MTLPGPLAPASMPAGIRSRFAENINGLRVHFLEAGYETPGRPLLLLLHGFPELAWSWRKVMRPLAEAGYHVVAPDQRGYGRTTGWRDGYDEDLGEFRLLNLGRDAVGLVHALGYREATAVVGHDFGSPVAGYCALVRPDVFRRAAMMSAPFPGPPALPFGTAAGAPPPAPAVDIQAALAALPRPRKHYHWYYSTRPANADMMASPQGLHAFLRAYYHHKSADWAGNNPFTLKAWSAGELAKLPTYYVMELAQTMPETVAPHMPDAAAIAACRWLPDEELAVYAAEYGRTGFQGGLNWYRLRTVGRYNADMEIHAGQGISVPAIFVAGSSDWGAYQTPGALERMQGTGCRDLRGVHMVPGAGHWVQQEQPEATVRILLDFLRATGA